jgi:hypothetical protein
MSPVTRNSARARTWSPLPSTATLSTVTASKRWEGAPMMASSPLRSIASPVAMISR